MRSTILAAAAVLAAAGASHAQWFASRVLDYSPAAGQLVDNPAYNDPARALGPPIGGGTLAPDNTKLVSLGGFGGSITLAFDQTVPNLPPTPPTGRNPRGLDFIVFGNAFWVGGNPNRRFAEPAIIEISLDVNHNGLADDPWYLIPGSHLAASPVPQRSSQTWDTNTDDPTFPPANVDWLPPGSPPVWTTWGYQLPVTMFPAGPIVTNPNGLDAAAEGMWGYADCSPTLVLGDTQGDNLVHDALLPPDQFYTVPDDPLTVGVTPGSGGGDAFDIAWAIDESTGQLANLPGFDFIRITSAINLVHPIFGEMSAEIGGVARVRVPSPADWDGDGRIEPADIAAFVNTWFTDLLAGGHAADFDGNGATEPADIAAFVNDWFGEL